MRTPQIYHTVLDRPLFRAGETVSMKHFLRRHDVDGRRHAAARCRRAQGRDHALGSGQKLRAAGAFGADGIAESSGRFRPRRSSATTRSRSRRSRSYRQSGSFRVEQYRLPTMRASVQGRRSRWCSTQVRGARPARRLPVGRRRLRAAREAAHGGRAAAAAAFRATTTIDSAARRSAKASDRPATAAVTSIRGRAEAPAQTAQGAGRSRSRSTAGRGARHDRRPAAARQPAQLTAELEYADANGEMLTATGRVRLVPVRV